MLPASRPETPKKAASNKSTGVATDCPQRDETSAFTQVKMPVRIAETDPASATAANKVR